MTPRLTRREMIRGSVAMAALAFAQHPWPAFGVAEPEEAGTLLPFLETQPPGKMSRGHAEGFPNRLDPTRRWT